MLWYCMNDSIVLFVRTLHQAKVFKICIHCCYIHCIFPKLFREHLLILFVLDPTHWLPTVCIKSCQITIKETLCDATSGLTIRLNVSDGLRISFPVHMYSTICLGCHNISEVNIACKLNFVMCVKNETIKSTSSQTMKRKQTGSLSLQFNRSSNT